MKQQLSRINKYLCVFLIAVLMLGNAAAFAHEPDEVFLTPSYDADGEMFDPVDIPADEYADSDEYGGSSVSGISGRFSESSPSPRQSKSSQGADEPQTPNFSPPRPMSLPPSGNGTGTSSNPFIILDADDLADLADQVVNQGNDFEGVFFELGDDIDLASYSNWAPIGDVDTPFMGQFDGNYHTISNLTIDRDDWDQGLFGCIEDASIKNLTIEGVDIKGGDYAGALASYALDCTLENITVREAEITGRCNIGGVVGELGYGSVKDIYIESSRIYAEENPDSSDNSSGFFVGGLTGLASKTSTIENVSADADVTVGIEGQNHEVGGLIGNLQEEKSFSTAVSNCDFYGSVEGGRIVGGIAGAVIGDSIIDNCNTYGSVSGDNLVGGIAGTVHASYISEGNSGSSPTIKNCQLDAAVTGSAWVGGIVGALDHASSVSNCTTTSNASVSGDKQYIGGIAGLLRSWQNTETAVISGCTNNAEVLGDDTGQYVGGIAGLLVNHTAIENCENNGDITGYQSVGGIVGWANAVATDSGSPAVPTPDTQRLIKNCGNNGQVTAVDIYAGGIAGRIYDGSVKQCYNTGNVRSEEVHTNMGYGTGGIVGSLVSYAYSGEDDQYASECCNSGSVFARGGQIGGIVGLAQGYAGSSDTVISRVRVENCSNAGSVIGETQAVGGIVGSARHSRIGYCYNTADVTGEASIGGIVGTGVVNARIEYCNSLGKNVNNSTGSNDEFSTVGRINGNFSIYETTATGNVLNRNRAFKWQRLNGGLVLGTLSSWQGYGLPASVFITDDTVWTSNDVWKYYNTDYPGIWAVKPGDDLPTLQNIPGAVQNGAAAAHLVDPILAKSTLNGSGTPSNPYEIGDVDDLLLMAKWITDDPASYRDKAFALTENIDMDGVEWLPMGSPEGGETFTGIFDGGNHSIQNLTIENANHDYVGLFSQISGSDAAVKDLTLEDCRISGYLRNTGALAGVFSNGAADNITVTGTVRGSAAHTSHGGNLRYTGGIFGAVNHSSISNCLSSADVQGYENVGGISGYTLNSQIQKCRFAGTLSAFSASGGIIGNVSYHCKVEDCIVDGDITGRHSTGGIAGNVLNSSVSGSYVTAGSQIAVENASGRYAGGLVGYMQTYITPSTTVTYKTPSVIADCYSHAQMVTDVIDDSYTNTVGGLVGYAYSTDTDGGGRGSTIQNCYAASAVDGGGGLSGFLSSGDIMKNCAALNPSVDGTADAARVVSFQNAGTLQNNYAWKGNHINGEMIDSDDAGHNHGEDLWPYQFRDKAFWEDELYFDDTIWQLDDDALPVLINLEGQNKTIPAYMNPGVTLTVEPTNVTLKPEQTTTLRTEVLPVYAYDTSVSFLSIDPQGVSVDTEGVITAHKPGDYTITVSAYGNVQEVISVKVEGGGTTGNSGGSSSGRTVTVTIQCIDEDSKVLTTQSTTGVIGSNITVRAPEIEGYQVLDDSPVIYTVKAAGNTVIFRYEKIQQPGEGETVNHAAYISGYPEGTFKPDNSMTRAEAASMLYNLADKKASSLPHIQDFTDVRSGTWYYDPVMDLAGRQIISGYPDGSYGAGNTITRAELITLAVNFAGIQPMNGAGAFSDVDSAHWAAGSIQAAVQGGILSGYPDGTFKPDNPITRAEVVSILNIITGRVDCSISNRTAFTDVNENHWAYEKITTAATEHFHE